MSVVIIPSGAGVTGEVEVTYNPPSLPSLGIVYTSVGERWDSIANKMYGDATQVTPLIQFNPGTPIYDVVPSGTQVFVPLLVFPAPTTTTTPWS